MRASRAARYSRQPKEQEHPLQTRMVNIRIAEGYSFAGIQKPDGMLEAAVIMRKPVTLAKDHVIKVYSDGSVGEDWETVA